ncbi:FtsB family cell division protein [Gemella bergeri]
MMEQSTEKQFRKDVLKAKAKYRKRRKFLILSIMTLMLVVTLIQTFLYTREKKELNTQLSEQNKAIEKLEKENKVNEIVIDKLKDPYFISDMVRQEYGLSYSGEIIFNLPLREKFLQTTINSIMQSDFKKSQDKNGRIDDSKIPELNKKDNEKTDGKNSNDKNKDATNSENKNNNKKQSEDTKNKEDQE